MSKIATFKQKTFKHSLKDVYAYLETLEKGINGDMVLTVTPAILGSSATVVNAAIGGVETKFVRTVTVELKTAADERCTFLNGTFAIAVAEVTVGTGTATIAGGATTILLTEGKGTVDLEYIGAWAAADTQTLTITGSTKLGYAISDKTSVDTLIA
jgi:hypothetical protein